MFFTRRSLFRFFGGAVAAPVVAKVAELIPEPIVRDAASLPITAVGKSGGSTLTSRFFMNEYQKNVAKLFAQKIDGAIIKALEGKE